MVPYPFWDAIPNWGLYQSQYDGRACFGHRLAFEDNNATLSCRSIRSNILATDEMRRQALNEMWRVTSKAIVVGFPAGESAFAADKELSEYYGEKKCPFRIGSRNILRMASRERYLESIWGERSTIVSVPNESIKPDPTVSLSSSR